MIGRVFFFLALAGIAAAVWLDPWSTVTLRRDLGALEQRVEALEAGR